MQNFLKISSISALVTIFLVYLSNIFEHLKNCLSSIFEKSKVTFWIGSKKNFALLRSMLLCLRGSRQKLVNERRDIVLEHTGIKHH